MVGRTKRERVQVGDRVRFSVAALQIEADVVEDRGHIGVDGRHIVAVSYTDFDGSVLKHDWPADELTVVKRSRAASRP